MTEIIFPTELHKQATEVIKRFFLEQKNIDTILLVNSIARGKASPDSDIDIAVLVSQTISSTEMVKLDITWNDFLNSNPTLNLYRNSNKFAQIHLDIIDGIFEPAIWEDGGSIDFFEVEIGNRLLYSASLTNIGEHFLKLKSQWLPYYGTTLQTQRLNLAKAACLYDLDHIPLFVKRGLYFQAFDRLYVAFQKFLQTLFIKHKTYPIAYNKWIKDQIVEILNLPDLYKELPNIISVNKIESAELIDKAKTLNKLLDQHC
ncbi:MAG: nucleotidyltransferase domain-containing protein [Chitinophagaceae bacterium]